jgi:hypothetical protein
VGFVGKPKNGHVLLLIEQSKVVLAKVKKMGKECWFFAPRAWKSLNLMNVHCDG